MSDGGGEGIFKEVNLVHTQADENLEEMTIFGHT
jgi:hypothetical protein